METLDLGDGSPDTQIESLNIAVSEFKVWILLNTPPLRFLCTASGNRGGRGVTPHLGSERVFLVLKKGRFSAVPSWLFRVFSVRKARAQSSESFKLI